MSNIYRIGCVQCAGVFRCAHKKGRGGKVGLGWKENRVLEDA